VTRGPQPSLVGHRRVAVRQARFDDHGRLKARLRPMRGLKTFRSARILATGHAFVQTCDAATTTSPPTYRRIRGCWRLSMSWHSPSDPPAAAQPCHRIGQRNRAFCTTPWGEIPPVLRRRESFWGRESLGLLPPAATPFSLTAVTIAGVAARALATARPGRYGLRRGMRDCPCGHGTSSRAGHGCRRSAWRS